MCGPALYTLKELKQYGYRWAAKDEGDFYIDLNSGEVKDKATNERRANVKISQADFMGYAWVVYEPDYSIKKATPAASAKIAAVPKELFVLVDGDSPPERVRFLAYSDFDVAQEIADEENDEYGDSTTVVRYVRA